MPRSRGLWPASKLEQLVPGLRNFAPPTKIYVYKSNGNGGKTLIRIDPPDTNDVFAKRRK